MGKKIQLNLGCFNKPLPGFINVDIRDNVSADVIDNAFTLEKFEKKSGDLIYASHMLEHLTYEETEKALMRWYEVLKDDGILRLAVPDIERVCAHYMYYKDLEVLMHMIYGSQRHPYDYHKNGWDEDRLKKDLLSVGFKDVRRWNWQDISPHSYCDDYSQAYSPHMDKENGMLMSLNVEAIK